MRRSPYLHGARSAVLFGCPRVTVFHRDSLSIGHATGMGGQAVSGPMLLPGAGIDSCAMGEGRVDPEGCLRSLTAEALLSAYPQGPLDLIAHRDGMPRRRPASSCDT